MAAIRSIFFCGRRNSNLFQIKNLISFPAFCRGHKLRFTGNRNAGFLFYFTKVINGNGAALAVFAGKGAAGDVQIQGIVVFLILRSVRTIKHIQSIRQPHIS